MEWTSERWPGRCRALGGATHLWALCARGVHVACGAQRAGTVPGQCQDSVKTLSRQCLHSARTVKSNARTMPGH
eukprot:5788574-Pyramimonas_sp.AAC.1